MQTCKTLPELAKQVDSERQRARDYRVRSDAITLADDLTVKVGDLSIAPRRLFHDQLAEKTGIPVRYYQRMATEAPELLARNVNTWLHREKDDKRLVRTLEGPRTGTAEELTDNGGVLAGRAFLSSSYRPLDNFDMLTALVPPLISSGLEVKSSEITEQRLYLQLVTNRITAEVKKGDAVQLGLVVSNSEVGCGALSIRVLVYRLACTNGLIVGDDLPSFRRAHIGKEFSVDENILTDETRKLRDASIWAQARDVITNAVSQTTLDKVVERLTGIASVELKNPEKAVELITKRYDLVQDERNEIMKNLISGGDVSQYGLVNAVTAIANTEKNYDRVIELESIGGKIAALAPSEIGNN